MQPEPDGAEKAAQVLTFISQQNMSCTSLNIKKQTGDVFEVYFTLFKNKWMLISASDLYSSAEGTDYIEMTFISFVMM